MNIPVKTIDEFFTAIPEREADLRRLDEIIQKTVPQLKRELFISPSITLLSYGLYHFKYASGQEGDWPVIGLANQKNHISLYIAATKDDQYLAEIYGDKLGKVSNGKSCIRFKKLENLNLPEIEHIIKEAAEWWEKQKN